MIKVYVEFMFVTMIILIFNFIALNISILNPHKLFLHCKILNIVAPFITNVFLGSILITKMKH